MKKLLFLFLLLTQLGHAQPGDRDFLNSRIRRLEAIGDSLAKNPKNYELVWERTELLFRPYFSLYSWPGRGMAKDSISQRDAFYEYSALRYKDVEVLGQLNTLIQHVDSLKSLVLNNGSVTAHVTKANFYYKRGQYYYLNNQPDKALADYLRALGLHPDDYTKTRICVALAAYYYNLGRTEANMREPQTQANLQKALDYIDRIAPQYDKAVVALSTRNHLDYNQPFEQEKTELLKLTNQYNRLGDYYVNKAYSFLNLYNQMLDQSRQDASVNKETIRYVLGFALQSLNDAQKYIANRKIDLLIKAE